MKKMADLIDRNAITLVKTGAYKGCTEQDIYKMREIKRAYLQKMLLEGLKASNTKMTKSAFAYILDAADKFVPGVAMTESQEKFAGLCEAALSAAVNERLALMQKKAEGEMMESMPGEISPEMNMANADPSVLVDPSAGDIIQQLISAAGLTPGDGVFYGGEAGVNDLADQGLGALETTGMTNTANLNDKMFLAVMNKISNLVDMLTKQASEGGEVGNSNVTSMAATDSKASEAAEDKIKQGNTLSVSEVKKDPNVDALAANTIQDNYSQITEKKVEDPAMVAAASNPEQKTANKKASFDLNAMCDSFYNQIKTKK